MICSKIDRTRPIITHRWWWWCSSTAAAMMSAKSPSDAQGMVRPPQRWSKPNSSSTRFSSVTNAGWLRHAVGITSRFRPSPTYTARWPRGTSAAADAGDRLRARCSLVISCPSFPAMISRYMLMIAQVSTLNKQDFAS